MAKDKLNISELEKIIVREITENDFEALVLVFREFAEYQKAPDKMLNTIDKMRADKDYINGFVAIDENGKIAGYTIYFFAYYTWVGKSLYMDDLYICPQYRGKGLGTVLINKVIELAKKEKCNRLRWQVSDWNTPAQKFYEALGAKIDSGENNCDLFFTP